MAWAEERTLSEDEMAAVVLDGLGQVDLGLVPLVLADAEDCTEHRGVIVDAEVDILGVLAEVLAVPLEAAC
jgi:hypothetical protein